MTMTKICAGPKCSKTFTPPPNNPRKKYHSSNCASLARYHRVKQIKTYPPRVCAKVGCSETFTPKVWQQKFHTPRCRIVTYRYQHYLGVSITKQLAHALDSFAQGKGWTRGKAAIFMLNQSTPKVEDKTISTVVSRMSEMERYSDSLGYAVMWRQLLTELQAKAQGVGRDIDPAAALGDKIGVYV